MKLCQARSLCTPKYILYVHKKCMWVQVCTRLKNPFDLNDVVRRYDTTQQYYYIGTYISFFVLFSCDARRHKVSMNSVTRISKRCPMPQQLKRSRIGRRRKKEGSSYFFLEIAYVDTLQTSLVVEKINHSINVCSIIGSQNYFSSKPNFFKSYIKTKFCSII